MYAGELHRLARALREIAVSATADPGEPRVSTGQLAIAEDISYHPRTSVGEIAARTGLAQSFVSRTIVRMGTAGTVRTEADPADRRRSLISINPALQANDFQSRGRRPITSAIRAAFPGLTDERLAVIMDALDTLGAELLH
ncbi:MarR family winged helix-turn-helix transcriptional regulator [Arthrobacter sp. 92]|uniref:MarR family winged helix-turn-helix transcriptional regulator n=1 Tax=Arthrobacter sp. 92 TaxID=3418175 RepID=UPI003D00160B